jgi:hypothetical protein
MLGGMKWRLNDTVMALMAASLGIAALLALKTHLSQNDITPDPPAPGAELSSVTHTKDYRGLSDLVCPFCVDRGFPSRMYEYEIGPCSSYEHGTRLYHCNDCWYIVPEWLMSHLQAHREQYEHHHAERVE